MNDHHTLTLMLACLSVILYLLGAVSSFGWSRHMPVPSLKPAEIIIFVTFWPLFSALILAAEIVSLVRGRRG